MDRAYYNEYYNLERLNWWFTIRRKILSERISLILGKPTQLHSLNIGAATGSTSDMLKEFGDVMSIEFDQECCDFTKTFLTTPIIQGSILELPFENECYDLVTAFDVIEHVEDDVKSIDEMYRVCKPGGYIVITVPAYQFLWSEHDVVNHHYRRYTLNQLLHLLENKDGKIIYKTYFNSILFFPIVFFRLLTSGLKKVFKNNEAESKSDSNVFGTKGFFNNFLSSIFKIDYYLLKWGFRFPAGVSIMLFFKKN